MVSLRSVVPALFVVVAACGGSDFGNAFGTPNDGGGEAGSDGSSASDGATAANDGGDVSDAAGGRETGPKKDSGGDCPDVSGLYALAIVEGAGCGDLNASARQCLRQNTCAVTFRSEVPQGQIPAINGNVALAMDGSFMNAMLTEGTVNRSGCVGKWDDVGSVMTVDCGGTGSSQSCVVALTRTNALCN